jgi:hypothetical protein
MRRLAWCLPLCWLLLACGGCTRLDNDAPRASPSATLGAADCAGLAAVFPDVSALARLGLHTGDLPGSVSLLDDEEPSAPGIHELSALLQPAPPDVCLQYADMWGPADPAQAAEAATTSEFLAVEAGSQGLVPSAMWQHVAPGVAPFAQSAVVRQIDGVPVRLLFVANNGNAPIDGAQWLAFHRGPVEVMLVRSVTANTPAQVDAAIALARLVERRLAAAGY